MKLIFGYFKRTGKPWAYIDQAWILEKIEEWYKVKMSRSTLNRNLRILEDEGFLIRTQRHIRDKGVFVPRVTMFKITKKLGSYFHKAAQFFKRCNWAPSVKALKAGYRAVVGIATNPEEAWREYNRLRKRGAN